MKKTRIFCLISLLPVLLSSIGYSQQNCDEIGRQLEKANNDMQRLSENIAERMANPNLTPGEGKALASQIKQMEATLQSLGKLAGDLANKYSLCIGRGEGYEAKRNADIKTQKQEWESKAKPYENANAASGTMSQGMAAITPPAGYPSGGMQYGSGRTKQQRDAALAAVNAELDRIPYVLPKKENAPSKNDILKLAGSRNALARKNFGPEEQASYSRVVTWIPRFDGNSPDPQKAKDYSLLVSSVTNYFQKPQLTIALASAVFSLDPQSTAGANNLASAIVSAGERLYPDKAQLKALAPYRSDAEACYLYAIATSMQGSAWTNESRTAIINLGNLYIDMGKPDQARSLFQVARKLHPFSWDAALGMAAYFHAVGKPDKAVAILEDDNLDRPQTLMVMKKKSKALENKKEVPIGSSEEIYEKHLEEVNSEPILTAADFMSQIDQSERNKMRYFIEHLPPQGSFTAPPVKKLSQYAGLKAISSPQGISALKDFSQMLQVYSMSNFASAADEQLKMLSRLGLNLDPGVDLNDVASHPEKYVNSKTRPKAKMDKEELQANIEKLRTQAKQAMRELATRKTDSMLSLASKTDPSFAILQIDPQDYADPMNIIVQKHNFAVLNRKMNLYNGYLYTVNKKMRQAFEDEAAKYQRIVYQAEQNEIAALERLEKAPGGGAEKAILRHKIHVQYFNACNGAAEAAFGSSTNVAVNLYLHKIKPKVEAYYYDVIRHVALITDTDVRDQKDAELRRAIYSALVSALNTVGAAHGSFKYHPSWECGCNEGSLLQERDAELKATEEEEKARILRNRAAKVVFDSGEIPQSSPLWQRLDNYGFDFDYFFFSGRMSCARTVVNFDLTVPLAPGSPKITIGQEISEFTGAGKYDQGIGISVGAKDKDAGVGAKAYLNLSSSIKMDGQGVVRDYSVTAGTGVTVSANGTAVSVGGQLTFGPHGEVRDSDFSAGIKKDFSNEMGGEGKVAFEASTKRGCSLTGKAEQTIESANEFIDSAKTKALGEDAAGLIPTEDIFKKEIKKELWPGKFKKEKVGSAN